MLHVFLPRFLCLINSLFDPAAHGCLTDCAPAPSYSSLFDPAAHGCLTDCAPAPSYSSFDPVKDAKHFSFTEPTSKHTNFIEGRPSIRLIYSWGATIFTTLLCFTLSVHAYAFGPHDEYLYAIWIAYTPGVHAVDQLVRQIFLTDESRLLFTHLEALREVYSATAAICFMRIIDIQLKNHYRVDCLNEILRNKLFSFHYPFNVREPTIYRTNRENLSFMRTLAYQNVASTTILYALRIVLEYMGVFGEICGHIFQIVYFISSTSSILAVYAYAQGVDPEIPELKMARKVGLFKLVIFLLWFQGPGIELMLAAQTYLIMASLIWYCCKQMRDLIPRAE